MKHRTVSLLAVFVLALAGLACGGTEEPAPTDTPAPTDRPEPTDTPEPSDETEEADATEPLDVLWHIGGEIGSDLGQFNSITGMDVSIDGLLLVADNLGRIAVVSPDGEPLTSIEADDLRNVADVAVGPDGTIYAADWGSSGVYAFSPGGDPLFRWGGVGVVEGGANFTPDALAVCSDGMVYVADTNVDDPEAEYERIQILDAFGNYLGEWSITADAPDFSLSAMDCGPDNRVYLVGFLGDSVLVYDSTGALVDELGGETISGVAADGLAVGPDGAIYVGTWNDGLVVLDAEGKLVTTWGEGVGGEEPRVAGQLYYPEGVAVGADGAVYLGDWGGGHSYVAKFRLP